LITKEDNSQIEEIEAKTARRAGCAYITFLHLCLKRPRLIEF